MNRKLIAYALLMFYIAFQLRPLTVVVSDVMAHTFFKAQHMATIHFENGKYHVHADLKAIADDENGTNKASSSSLKKASESDVHVVQDLNFYFNPHLSSLISSTVSAADVLQAYLQLDVPPPRA